MKILIDMKTSFNLISEMYFCHSHKALKPDFFFRLLPNEFDILVSIWVSPPSLIIDCFLYVRFMFESRKIVFHLFFRTNIVNSSPQSYAIISRSRDKNGPVCVIISQQSQRSSFSWEQIPLNKQSSRSRTSRNIKKVSIIAKSIILITSEINLWN